MTNKDYIEKCKEIIVKYFNSHCEKTDKVDINKDDIYVVWYCKTLQNCKALLSTNISDGMYYEMTYNGDKGEIYMDAYKKWENKCITL